MKELLAITNTNPSLNYSGKHKDLTIVNKPEKLDQPAIYSKEELEKAVMDKEAIIETSGHEDFEVVELTINQVSKLSQESKQVIKENFDGEGLIEIPTHSPVEEGTAIICWKPISESEEGERVIDIVYKKQEQFKLQEMVTRPKNNRLHGEISERRVASNPEELIKHTEEVMSQAYTTMVEGDKTGNKQQAEVFQ